jgi:hypothetical protein
MTTTTHTLSESDFPSWKQFMAACEKMRDAIEGTRKEKATAIVTDSDVPLTSSTNPTAARKPEITFDNPAPERTKL